MLIFGIFALIATCHSQSSDWSFEKRCEFLKGEYTKASDYTDPNPVGERCKATFSYPTGDPQLARKFCEETVPFHIIDATADGPRTTCLSEAGLICKTNWIQLYGRCYFMEKKQMTYSEAQGYCKKLDSRIAFMHRDILPVHWNTYYTKSAKAWVDGSSVYRDNLMYNKGDNMMLVFHGEHYRIKSLSLIRVDGSVEKAFPLCEYTPLMTRAESNYLLRRYSEIYHSGFTTQRGMFIRTTSFRHADNEGRKASDSRYCEKAMKPFIHGAKVDNVKASEEEEEFLKVLSGRKNEMLSFYRGTDFLEVYPTGASQPKSKRDMPNCGGGGTFSPDARIYRTRTTKCDGASWSSVVNLYAAKPFLLDKCSDALRGPLYCEAKLGVREYGGCPSEYSEYMRSGGVKWCHRFFTDSMTAEDAEARCRRDFAHLSGAESKDELKFMASLNKANQKDAWLGAERRSECRWGGGTASQNGWKDGGECSRELVFQWANYAAINPPFFDDNTWDTKDEPNYRYNTENCLQVYLGYSTVNDLKCDRAIPFFCGREADAVG